MNKISTYDLRHPGYDKKFHTGKMCIAPGCDKPAGTKWGYHWCPIHDIERREKISSSIKKILQGMSQKKEVKSG